MIKHVYTDMGWE